MQADMTLNVGKKGGVFAWRVELVRHELDAFVGPVGWSHGVDIERVLDWISEAVNLTLPIQRMQVECLSGIWLGVWKRVGH